MPAPSNPKQNTSHLTRNTVALYWRVAEEYLFQ